MDVKEYSIRKISIGLKLFCDKKEYFDKIRALSKKKSVLNILHMPQKAKSCIKRFYLV